MPREGTEVPPAPIPGDAGTASDPPLLFTAVLWIGAFFTIVWGFRVLFSRLSGTDRPSAGNAHPDGEDVTTEDRGTDRS